MNGSKGEEYCQMQSHLTIFASLLSSHDCVGTFASNVVPFTAIHGKFHTINKLEFPLKLKSGIWLVLVQPLFLVMMINVYEKLFVCGWHKIRKSVIC